MKKCRVKRQLKVVSHPDERGVKLEFCMTIYSDDDLVVINLLITY